MATRSLAAAAAECSLELPAVIAADVPIPKFTEALARAGLVGRRDVVRGVLVIEPIPPLCVGCGGTGLDEDAVCDLCDGAAYIRSHRPKLPVRKPAA